MLDCSKLSYDSKSKNNSNRNKKLNPCSGLELLGFAGLGKILPLTGKALRILQNRHSHTLFTLIRLSPVVRMRWMPFLLPMHNGISITLTPPEPLTPTASWDHAQAAWLSRWLHPQGGPRKQNPNKNLRLASMSSFGVEGVVAESWVRRRRRFEAHRTRRSFLFVFGNPPERGQTRLDQVHAKTSRKVWSGGAWIWMSSDLSTKRAVEKSRPMSERDAVPTIPSSEPSPPSDHEKGAMF